MEWNRERSYRGEYNVKKKKSSVCVACRYRTKLAASLARCRIKHDLLSIESMLPESVKTKQQRSSRLPLYTWVNTLKSRSARRAQTRGARLHALKHMTYTRTDRKECTASTSSVCAALLCQTFNLGFCPIFYGPGTQLTSN